MREAYHDDEGDLSCTCRTKGRATNSSNPFDCRHAVNISQSQDVSITNFQVTCKSPTSGGELNALDLTCGIHSFGVKGRVACQEGRHGRLIAPILDLSSGPIILCLWLIKLCMEQCFRVCKRNLHQPVQHGSAHAVSLRNPLE